MKPLRWLLRIALGLFLSPASGAAAPADFNDSDRASVVHPAWFKDSFLDLADDLKQARQAGKTGLLVFFSTKTCSYCQRFLDTTFAAPDIIARVRKRFDVIGLEILSDAEVIDVKGRSQRAKDFAVQEKARLTPTLVFYGEGGQQLAHLVGGMPAERFRLVLDYLEEHAYQKQTLRDFLMTRTSPPALPGSGDIRRSDLFTAPPHLLDRRAPGGRPLLVLFEQPECADCVRLHESVLSDAALRERLRQFQAVQLNMADRRNVVLTPDGRKLSPGAWADQLGLIHAPALLFFDEKGNEVLRIDSEVWRYRLDGALQYVLEKGYVEHPQFQRWRRARGNR